MESRESFKFPQESNTTLGNKPNVGRFTDDNGQDTITIEGAPQKRVMIDPHSVEKPGKVHAKVNLKSANIVQDVIANIPGVTSPLGFLISLPVEMSYRTGLGFERSHSFTVVDWDDCAAPSSANRITAKAAGVCSDTWTGTASVTLGTDPATSATTSASVTWVFKEVVGNVARYLPTGIASYKFPNCAVSPSSQTMSTQPDGGTGGSLEIDFSTEPPSYKVQGSTVWQASYCGGLTAGAGGMWVGDPGTFGPASGTVTAGKHAQTIGGSISAASGLASWNFKKD